MALPTMSEHKALVLTATVFIAAALIAAFFQSWWPAVFLVVGIPMTLYQYLRGRHYDAIVTSIVFFGAYATYSINVPWSAIMPVAFVVAAIALIGREFITRRPSNGDRKTQDVINEILESHDDD